MSDLEIRSAELEYREEADSDYGYIEGIGVPYGQTVTVYRKDGTSFQERVEYGALEPEGTVWLYNRHEDPIGVVVDTEHRSEGFWFRARLALSDLAVNVREQLRNGAVKNLSVAFVPVEDREEGGVIVRARARLREISVTDNPVYSLATVLHVREEAIPDREPVTNHKEETVEDSAVSPAELTEVRGHIEELEQRMSMLTVAPAAEPKVETRSAGQIAQAIVAGDADTIARVNEIQERAYTGGTSADSPIKDAWAGDLTRIFDNTSGVLSGIFAKGALPEKGMNLEYARLASNTVKVEEQVNEGDDLAFGKVTLTTETVPVKTYGGYTQLTVQEIRRSTLPILDRHFEAMAVEAGKRKKATLRTFFNSVRAEQIAAGNVVTLGEGLDDATSRNWSAAIVNAALAYEELDATFDALVVSPDVFLALDALSESGNKVFQVATANTLGSLNLPGLTGSLAGVSVVVDTGAAPGTATFVNGRAIRQYNNGIVSLQDDNIINLTKTFSVYYFEALADEQPELIVPVVIAGNDA